ncbi:MAG: Gfo/Idh/MocA family oxidoreductase [Verrucomicrobiae bacterium]|nr:Gfo/Idh/MocA family oxidoreductase [Verrucomicrobiae bacterium]
MKATLKAAVIGCGKRGLDHARGYAACDGIELVALVDRAEEKRKAGMDRFQVAGYADVEEMLDQAKPDLVSIVTQPRGRADLTRQVAAGKVKAIVAEKPMALTMAEADSMVEACETAGIALIISHQMRFCREFVAGKEAICRGEIGEIQFLRGVCYGNLLNQGTHVLDMIRWYAGEPKLEWVMASWSDDAATFAELLGDPKRAAWKDEIHPAPMWMHCYFAFEGGVRASLECGLLYSRAGDSPSDWLQKRVCAVGTEGMIETRVAGDSRVLPGKAAGWKKTAGDLRSWTDATPAFLAELRDALNHGGTHRNHARESAQTFEGLMACAQAAVDGGIVRLPADRSRDALAELNACAETIKPNERKP